ncbi:hypothetical protein LCL96_16090 [Rossellomorea aquimaris]|uniref:hypothetical protein n=1 Tax=Rossellomorea aquimaris TaxID=189382 RepID=UPI001CD50ED4|nr:hypothetical protein [Rossellomorea aquimaris]MCA1060459.1 hypothetical protein [Rossellomorea aquimaris]
MLRRRFVAVLCILAVFIVTACSKPVDSEQQNIVVEKQVGDENKYEEFKKVTDTNQVEEVREILSNTHWKEAQVDFIRPADYRFIYEYQNPEIDAKAVLHSVWVSPKKDELEVMQGDHEYAQLPKKESARLFKILTGERLGE